MSFKPGLFPIFVIFVVIAPAFGEKSPDDDLFISEYSLVINRSECWTMGGVIYNRQTNIGEKRNTVRASSVKMVFSGNVSTVYNFGSQFFSEPGTEIVLEDGKKYYLSFWSGKPQWIETSEGESYCQRILDYKCLSDIVINSTEELEKVSSWKCKQIHGDLVITGFGTKSGRPSSKTDLSFLEEIENIRGRLIISKVLSGREIKFTKLEEVGRHISNMTDTSRSYIQISGNKVNKVLFPKMNIGQCNKEYKGPCLQTDNNNKIPHGHLKDHNSTEVIFGNTPVPDDSKIKYIEEDVRHLRKMPDELRAQIKSEKDLDDRKLKKHVIDWDGQRYGSGGPYFWAVFGLSVVGFILAIFHTVLKNKDKLPFDRLPEHADDEEIEKNDEITIKTTDDDYFEVKENNENNENKNKNSGMDDLGSL